MLCTVSKVCAQGQVALHGQGCSTDARCPSKTARCAASREDKWIFAITSKGKNELPGAYNRSRLRASEGSLWQIQVEDVSFHSCLLALAVHLAGLQEFIAPLIKSAERKTRLCLSRCNSQPSVLARSQSCSHISKEVKNRLK